MVSSGSKGGRWRALLLTAALAGGLLAPSGGAPLDRSAACQIDPSATDNFDLAQFRIWLPEPPDPVRGVLAVVPGSDTDGAAVAEDAAWQAIAARWHYALLGVTLTTRSEEAPYYRAELGSGEALLDALDEFSRRLGRPELARAPIAILGHSQGGQYAYHLACWRPDRVGAFATIKGGYYEARPNEAARAVPGLLIAGQWDLPFRRERIRRLFAQNETDPGKWCYALEPGVAHALGRSLDLVLPFFEAAASRPLHPVRGDPGTLAWHPVAEAAPPARGSWLPDAGTAVRWAQFSRGELPAESCQLRIPNSSPRELASVIPEHVAFGDLTSGQTPAPAIFRVEPAPGALPWDSVRAISLPSSSQVTVEHDGAGWKVTVAPVLKDEDAIGASKQALLLRFAHQGLPVSGGARAEVAWYHLARDLSLSARSLFAGTHRGDCVRSLRIASRRGALRLGEARTVPEEGATLRLARESETTVRLEATLRARPVAGPYAGLIVLPVLEPMLTEIRIPYLGVCEAPSSAP